MTVRICAECRWCVTPGSLSSICEHDLPKGNTEQRNLITGEVTVSPKHYCVSMRDEGPCGQEGRFFEARR